MGEKRRMIRAAINFDGIFIPKYNIRDFEDANELFAWIEEQLVRKKVHDTLTMEWFGGKDADVYISVDNSSMKFGLDWRKRKVFGGRKK